MPRLSRTRITRLDGVIRPAEDWERTARPQPSPAVLEERRLAREALREARAQNPAQQRRYLRTILGVLLEGTDESTGTSAGTGAA